MFHSPHESQDQVEKGEKKVGFITGEYPPMEGGVGDHTFRLAEALKLEGISALVITSEGARAGKMSHSPPESQEQGEKGASSPLQPLKVHPAVKGWGFLSWLTLDKLLGQESCLVLHIQYQTAAFGMNPAINFLPYWMRLRHRKLPIVVTMHDLRAPYLFPKAGPLRRWVTRSLIVGCDAVVVTNGEDLDVVGRMVGDAGRSHRPLIRLIPLGNNLPCTLPAGFDRRDVRRNLGVKDSELLLSYFGLLNQSKGVDVIIKSLGKLVEKGLEAKLLIIGGGVGSTDPTNRAYREKVMDLIEELKLAGRVLWAGYMPPEEVSAALVASDICLLPFNDGASFRRTTLLTALAHGLPVVTTAPQDPRAVELNHYGESARGGQLLPGENCLMVPPGDVESLTEAVEELAAHPTLREHLAQGARALGEAFSWGMVARKTAQLYRELLA